MHNSNQSSLLGFFQMPSEIKRDVSTHHSIGLVVATIVLVVMFNLVLRLFLNSYTHDLGLWIVHNKWDLLLNLDEPVDVLILGDSSANQDIVPERFDSQADLHAMNLATIANMTLVNDVWMLKTYLSRFPPPDKIIIVHTYQVWQRNPYLPAMYGIPYFRIPDKRTNLSPALNISITEHIDSLIYRYIPAYSEKTSLRPIIRTILQIPPDINFILHPEYTLSPLGYFLVEETDQTLLGEDIAEHQNYVNTVEVEISQANNSALTELIQLAEEYHMEVFYFHAPISEEIAYSTRFASHMDAINGFVEQAAGDSAYFHFFDEVPLYPRESLQSADHLLADAAIDYTDYIIGLSMDGE